MRLNYKSKSQQKLPKLQSLPKLSDFLSVSPKVLSTNRTTLPSLSTNTLRSTKSPSSFNSLHKSEERPSLTINSLENITNPTPYNSSKRKESHMDKTKLIYQDSLIKSRIIENPQENDSDESYSSDKQPAQPKLSISSFDMSKFNSAPNRLDSRKKSTLSSIVTDRSYINMPSSRFSTIRHESTINTILEEMNATNSVSTFNELKLKITTKDPLLEGIHGKVFRWKTVEVIGNGSFGQVLRAIDIDTGKIFAIKKLYFNNCNTLQVQFISALEQEMKILQKLKNEHIVEYKGCEKIDGVYCMYIEFLSGGSLSKLIYKLGPLPEECVKVYLRQILLGLQYLHSNGVIHRDLKGQNILLDSNGKVKLCDFGAAKRYEDDCNESGLVTSVKGSMPWMAPEVMKQSGYGRKADIWSLGCCAIEMISGKLPWDGVENQVILMMNMLIYSQSPEIPKTASVQAKDFISKCLERDPAKRPSASDLLNHPFVNKSRY